jgi:hypothetical protein
MLVTNSARAYETILENSPWVYPTTEANPTTTEYYKVLLTGGYNQINLVLWNHDHQYDFVLGKFVIAIKSGVDQITINSINLTFDTADLSGTSRPDSMPWDGIFPCPWKQYNVGINLTERQYNDGWHGAGDPSGIQVTIEITVNTNPANVHLYFVAWGYNKKDDGNLDWTKTPYSHITETFPPPPHVIPEVPVGSVMAASSMMVALGAYFGLRKRRIRFIS